MSGPNDRNAPVNQTISPVPIRSMVRTIGPAVLSGALLAFSFPAFNFYLLAWIALVPLLIATAGLPIRTVTGRFVVAGFVFQLIVLQWLLSNYQWAGGWAFIGWSLISAYLALYWGILGALWAFSQRNPSPWTGPWTFALAWVGVEWLQSVMFTGFGWSSLGYSQGRDFYLAQWAAVAGVQFISFFPVLVSALVASAWLEIRRRWAYAFAAVAVAAVAHLGGYFWIDDAEYTEDPYIAGVLQSDFPLEMKWDPEYTVEMVRNAAEKSTILARNNDVTLFVWPEALIMASRPHPEIERLVTNLCRTTDASLFTGAARHDDATGLSYNSSFLVDETGRQTGRYDKIRLAPFGEYVPLSKYLPFVRQFVPVIGGMAAGTEAKVFEAGERRFGPMICFEVLFGSMSEKLRAQGADFLVVVTNLAWFGASSALPQELEIARLRAIESRLPLVHAANTGVSGVFDPWGRFQVVNRYINRQGQVFATNEQSNPYAAIMERRIGALPVALPADRPFGTAPAYIPMLSLIVSFCLVGAACLRPARTKREPG